MPQPSSDVWETGAAYEPYVGRWSRLVARDFLSWLAVSPGADWLDVGCGTGALTAAILADAAPAHVRALDASAGYAAYARARTTDPRAAFSVADARALPCATTSADAVVSGLVLNFVPQHDLALAEMARVARPGAVVAVYVWDYVEGMQLMRVFWDAAVELDPAAGPLDEGRRFPLCRAEPLGRLFEDAGLESVEVSAIEVPTAFRDFDDYWSPFLGGQGPAPGYLASLDEIGRAALRERVRERLPIAADGSIRLHARAWAAKGIRAWPRRSREPSR